MTGWFVLPVPSLNGAIALGLSVALKATVLILVALVVHLILGQRRVLVRSVIWNGCLLGLILLPISAAFPRLSLDDPRGSVRPRAVARAVSEAFATQKTALATVTEPGALAAPASNLAPVGNLWLNWPAVLFLAYAAVAAVLAARLILSLLAVARLRWSSPAVEDPRWVEALERWRGPLGVSRRVRLLRSDRLGVPVVVGAFHPVVVLPEHLRESADDSTLDAVLVHELAHVRRGDYAWNVLLRLVQAIYWPHPLVWLTGRIIAGVREQACDDVCISWLGGSDRYCATLVDVTAGVIRRPWESLGLAMTRSTKLGRRLIQIRQSAGDSRCLLRAPARGAIIVTVLALFGLLGSATLVRPRAEEPRAQGKSGDHRVRVERLKRGDIRRTTTQVGSLHAFESADLFAKVSGYLKQQFVDIGDHVKKGQLLAVIDVPELFKEADQANDALEQARLAVKQAETRVKTAESELDSASAAVVQAESGVDRSLATTKFREKEMARYKSLREKNAIGQQILDEEEGHLEEAVAARNSAQAGLLKARADRSAAQSRVDQATADLQQARSSVRRAETSLARAKLMTDYTQIVSPYDGIVTLRSFHPGAYVRTPDAGTNVPLFRVARTDKMRLITNVPDRDVPYLERGRPAVIRLDGLPGQTLRAKVSRFSESEDPASRTMRTEIDLDNTGHKLREGMYGTVTIALNNPVSGLTVPTSALVTKVTNGPSSCFRIVDGRALTTPLQVGDQEASRIEVLGGLEEGDVVATNPVDDGVKEGQRVEVADQ